MWCADVRRAARHTIVRRTICAPCRRNTFLRRPVARRAAVTLFLAPATWRRAPPGIVTLFFACGHGGGSEPPETHISKSCSWRSQPTCSKDFFKALSEALAVPR